MEIYQDGGDAASAAASAPITPSHRRRGLGSSRNGGIQPQKSQQQHKASRHEHDDAARRRRRSTALTPKTPSDMNKKRKRRKSMQEKKASMVLGGGDLDEAKAATTATATENTTSSIIGTSTTTKTTAPPSGSSSSTSRGSTATSGSRSKVQTPESKIVKPKVSLTRLGLSPSKTAEAPKSPMATTRRPPTEDDTTGAGRSAAGKGEDTGDSTSTGTKASTPSSTSRSSSDLRKFIQQKRKEIRSSAEKDAGGNAIVSAAAATAKTVRFTSDVIAKEKEEEGRVNRDRGATLMDLTDEFRQEEVPSTETAGATTSAAKPKAAVAPKVPLTTPAPTVKKLPILSLGKFQESLWLDFGDEHRNVVGKTRSMSFLLEAPQSSETSSSSSSGSTPGYCSVEFERIPFKKGFNLIVEDDASPSSSEGVISDGNNGVNDAGSRVVFGNNSADDNSTTTGSDRSSPTVLCVKNSDCKRLRLTWTPTDAGGMREAVHLKLPRGRIRITAHGKARASNVKKGKKKAPTKTVSYVYTICTCAMSPCQRCSQISLSL